jgi:hypothetical protein
LFPICTVIGVSISDECDQVCGGIVNTASIVEQVVGQLIDVTHGLEVVTHDLEVLEGAKPARESNRVDRLHKSAELRTHLVIQLKFK